MASQAVPSDQPTGRFHPVAEYSATLPSHYYCDPAIHEREKEEIFFKAWQYAGALEDLQNPGDYVTSKLFDQELVVVREKDGALRAFYNVCMHRGHILAEGKGNKTIFTCPFHAWAYDTTGALKAAGNAENVAGFELGDFGLSEIRVEEFLNMAFVNLDAGAQSMRDMVGALEDEILSYMLDVSTFKHARTDIFELKCNWKFVLDQLECYHCPHIHPEAMEAVDITKRDSWEYDWWQSHISYIDDGRHGRLRQANHALEGSRHLQGQPCLVSVAELSDPRATRPRPTSAWCHRSPPAKNPCGLKSSTSFRASQAPKAFTRWIRYATLFSRKTPRPWSVSRWACARGAINRVDDGRPRALLAQRACHPPLRRDGVGSAQRSKLLKTSQLVPDSKRRSWLFLPGADEDALIEATTNCADVLIQELEDFTPAASTFYRAGCDRDMARYRSDNCGPG